MEVRASDQVQRVFICSFRQYSPFCIGYVQQQQQQEYAQQCYGSSNLTEIHQSKCHLPMGTVPFLALTDFSPFARDMMVFLASKLKKGLRRKGFVCRPPEEGHGIEVWKFTGNFQLSRITQYCERKRSCGRPRLGFAQAARLQGLSFCASWCVSTSQACARLCVCGVFLHSILLWAPVYPFRYRSGCTSSGSHRQEQGQWKKKHDSCSWCNSWPAMMRRVAHGHFRESCTLSNFGMDGLWGPKVCLTLTLWRN